MAQIDKYATSIRQTAGGNRIKSGDTASGFEFEILGADGQVLDQSGQGKLTLYRGSEIALRTDVEVTNGKFSFKFEEPVKPGWYDIDLRLNGYIFPTDRSRILVIASFA